MFENRHVRQANYHTTTSSVVSEGREGLAGTPWSVASSSCNTVTLPRQHATACVFHPARKKKIHIHLFLRIVCGGAGKQSAYSRHSPHIQLSLCMQTDECYNHLGSNNLCSRRPRCRQELCACAYIVCVVLYVSNWYRRCFM